MRKAQGLYIISVAAQLLELHPQTLRKYERAGFIEPPRMGTLRLYSEEDIARLRLIKYLVEELELNLAGVELALDVTNKLLNLRARLASESGEGATKQHALKGIDEVLSLLGVEVIGEKEAEQEKSVPPSFTTEARRGQPTTVHVRVNA
jgi:MerR family transcriptional regulator/heat shock protein HspR